VKSKLISKLNELKIITKEANMQSSLFADKEDCWRPVQQSRTLTQLPQIMQNTKNVLGELAGNVWVRSRQSVILPEL
jgi:hypothetical protein